jgi:dihydropteroate synthase
MVSTPILSCGRFRLQYRGVPLVMGVLNTTPDSFSDGGRWMRPADAVRRAEAMVADGASLIDVGGESTRPGSAPVNVREELRRVMPVIERLAPRLAVPISIDTSKAEVARRAVQAGASMINDVTALRGDPAMAAVAAASEVPVVLMHMRGTPRDMQRRPRYRDVVSDVVAFLRERMQRAVAAGIPRSRLLIDPGLGFGKLVGHNLAILQRLERFLELGCPVVLGPSRKSFIGRVLGADVPDRLPGTLACVARAAAANVHIVRVHDVGPSVEVVRMWDAMARGPRWRPGR